LIFRLVTFLLVVTCWSTGVELFILFLLCGLNWHDAEVQGKIFNWLDLSGWFRFFDRHAVLV
jgi:hypothetical protein